MDLEKEQDRVNRNLEISLKSDGQSGKHDHITKKVVVIEGGMVNVYIHGKRKKRRLQT